VLEIRSGTPFHSGEGEFDQLLTTDIWKACGESNSQAPDYGGINTMGNPGYTIEAADGQLWLNLPSWAVLLFQKE
jgi:hypothetical protein